MTIAEKYSNLKNKTIEEIVLEIVEECAKKCKGQGLELVCGWWETDVKPNADSSVFDFMAGECYHKKINNK